MKRRTVIIVALVIAGGFLALFAVPNEESFAALDALGPRRKATIQDVGITLPSDGSEPDIDKLVAEHAAQIRLQSWEVTVADAEEQRILHAFFVSRPDWESGMSVMNSNGTNYRPDGTAVPFGEEC
jgi:hypothetical protein